MLTLETDPYIRILLKSGGYLDVHELQLEFAENENIKTVFRDILGVKETGAYLKRENLFIDGGQIGFLLLDERKYLK